MAEDPFHLQRFVDAQRGVIDQAVAELVEGRKQTHWMWFVFPQLAGLGKSPAAQFYGIRSLAEARAYLAHAELGPRLRGSVDSIVAGSGRQTAEQILGPIDALKLRSSLTLFDIVEPGAIFGRALEGFYEGVRDERTLALLSGTR